VLAAREKKQLSEASDGDVAYVIVLCFLNGELEGLEVSEKLHPVLRQICQKIVALKIGLAAACQLGKLSKATEEKIKSQSLERVMEVWAEKRKNSKYIKCEVRKNEKKGRQSEKNRNS
jgi:hypothetical protein